MDEKTLRLECLKLASTFTRDQANLLGFAKILEDHVNGPKEVAKSSESSNKNFQKKKVDNSKELF